MHQMTGCRPIFHAHGVTVLGLDEMKRSLPEEMTNIQRQVRMIHQLFQGIMNKKCLANDLECCDLELRVQIEQVSDPTKQEASKQQLMNHWVRLAKALGLRRSNGFSIVLKNYALDLWKVKRQNKKRDARHPARRQLLMMISSQHLMIPMMKMRRIPCATMAN